LISIEYLISEILEVNLNGKEIGVKTHNSGQMKQKNSEKMMELFG